MTPETFVEAMRKVRNEAFERGLAPGVAADKLQRAVHLIAPLVGLDAIHMIDLLVKDTKLKGGAE